MNAAPRTSFARSSAIVGFGLAITLLAGCGTNLKPRVQQMNGRAVEVVTAGTGGPTVVFESGFQNDWSPWDRVASAVSLHGRVFAYSRPGYGDSDPVSTPRDPQHIVDELRQLLLATGHAPPYVLVGHSFGGTYMELFARLHPSEVAGLVLVDSRHADFTARCQAAHLDVCAIPDDAVSGLSQVEQDEYRGFQRATDELRAAGPFGDHPVRVLIATDHGNGEAWDALWQSLLGALASEARDGRPILFPGAGHNLEYDRPAEVAQAIVDVLDAQRARP